MKMLEHSTDLEIRVSDPIAQEPRMLSRQCSTFLADCVWVVAGRVMERAAAAPGSARHHPLVAARGHYVLER